MKLDRLLSRQYRKRSERLERRPPPRAFRRRLHALPKNPTGLKRWFVPGQEEARVLTPYAAKERRRRRRAGKIAHESRRRNRS